MPVSDRQSAEVRLRKVMAEAVEGASVEERVPEVVEESAEQIMSVPMEEMERLAVDLAAPPNPEHLRNYYWNLALQTNQVYTALIQMPAERMFGEAEGSGSTANEAKLHANALTHCRRLMACLAASANKQLPK